MRMRLRSAHVRSRRRPSPTAPSGGRTLAVALVDHPAVTEERVRTLAACTPSFEVVAAGTSDRWGGVPPLPCETDVVVLAVDDGARSMAALRELRRTGPAWRLVVIADDTEWFEEAFELGADAWVGQAADDRTVELAITGERFVRDLPG
jgi:DNA-binding NarL/FixJ family response regulator